MIQFIDTLEESRDLSLQEWNFRKIVQDHLMSLLEQQKIYWQQRGRIKWATLGDESTKFLHANATIRHNKNVTLSLKNEAGEELFKHEEKAELLWPGTSEFTQIHFDLSSILQRQDGQDTLILPISREQIDCVISELPVEKSPGPYGFNSDFMKKCWRVIAHDFYALCSDFYDHNICLQSINGSFITLVPKLDNPSSIIDFRPISLLNSSIKLITKVLANRLQKVILGIIHKN
jgi:hypothetical protein